MPRQELTYLKRLGLSHQAIADALGVTKHTVGNWWHDRRVVSPPYAADLIELAHVLQERIARGLSATEAIRGFKPTGYDNPDGGGRTLSPGIPLRVTPDDEAAEHAGADVLAIHLRMALRQLAGAAADTSLDQLTAEQTMTVRRLGMLITMIAEQSQWAAVTTNLGGRHDGGNVRDDRENSVRGVTQA